MKTSLQLIFSIILFIFSSQSLVQAENFRARIVKVQGQVYVVNSQGEKRLPKKQQFLVSSNETVVTQNGSKAVLQFDDGAMSVLGEKTSLKVEESGWLSQLSGKVYYVFRKIMGKQKSRKIKTKFATIGVRGTTFIVDANMQNQQVALQEGKLNIESPGDDYEIVKEQAAADDFAAFKQRAVEKQKKLNQEYTDYKKSINQQFIEYKKSFDLEANKVVSFSGRRVSEDDLDNDWQASFDDFSTFSKDYIGAYKELNKETEADTDEDFFK